MSDIYSTLFNRIISGEYPSGTRLKEEAIASEFNLSRTPVRSVLQQLEQDGLIYGSPNKGSWVLPFTADEIEEIYEIRKSLELLCLDFSSHTLSVQKLLALKKEIIANKDIEDFDLHTALDAELHSLIIEASNKKRLISMLNQLYRLIQNFRILGFASKELRDSTINEHLSILDALISRNNSVASELMKKHIENSKNRALSQLIKS